MNTHYYKVLSNGNVIDANCVFLKWQKKHKILIGCDISEANFIQSSDQEIVWRVPWLNPVDEEAGTYETADAVEIFKEEYDALRAQLDEGKTVEDVSDPEPQPEIPEPGEPDQPTETETVMSVPEMRRKIAVLEQSLAEQTERNDFLEGCLMEMSEIVYG